MRLHWKVPVHSPCLDKRAVKSGPIIVWGEVMDGPVSLEQFYGRTLNTMETQPKGNYWMPPVSYWNKRERNLRLAARRKELILRGDCRSELTCLLWQDPHLRAERISRRAVLSRRTERHRGSL